MLLRFAILVVLAVTAACGPSPSTEEFGVVRDSLVGAIAGGQSPGRRIFLNEEIRIVFDGAVDPLSVTPDTVRLRDQGDGHLVRGRLTVATRAVTFVPFPPCKPKYDDGSLRPGHRYRIEVAGFPSTNAVRSTSGRLLRRSFAREFATVEATQQPSPLLAVGVGDPRSARFEMTFFEPIAAEVGTLRLHFNLPPDPASVTPSAFRLQRVNSGVERVEIASVRVIPPDDLIGASGDYGRVPTSFPGCIVELQLGTHVVAGRDVYLSLEHDEHALRDYAGRRVEDFATGTERQPVVAIPVQPGHRLRVFEFRFTEPMEFVTDNPSALGFTAGEGAARPTCRVEAGSGSLGVLRPERDLVIAIGVPFDRGDGTLVRCEGPSFEFHAMDIPRGVTVVFRADVPIQVRAMDAVRIAGALVFDRTPPGKRSCLDGEPIAVQDLIDGSGVAVIAGGDVTVSGSIRRDGALGSATGSPFSIICGGRVRLFGRIPAGVVLAPENLVLEGSAALAKIVRAPMRRATPDAGNWVAEGWTPWLPLPHGRTRADEARLEGEIGSLAAAVQLAPPNPFDASHPIEDPGLVTQPLPLPLVLPLEWTPGSHVRFLLRAELRAGQQLPEVSGIVFLSR